MRKAVIAFLLIAFVVGARAPQAGAAAAEVHIVDGSPNPAQLTIQDGDTVTFVNDDDVAHAIYEGGVQRGRTIEPHTRSEPFGPFQTGGAEGRSEYQVDQDGPGGVIIVQSTTTTAAPTTTTSAPTTTTRPTTTVTTTTKPATTTTKATTTTTTTTTTTAPATSASSSPGATTHGTPSRVWLAVFGGLLALIGIANMVRVMTRPKHRREDQA